MAAGLWNPAPKKLSLSANNQWKFFFIQSSALAEIKMNCQCNSYVFEGRRAKAFGFKESLNL